jgi:hypothetical protein
VLNLVVRKVSTRLQKFNLWEETMNQTYAARRGKETWRRKKLLREKLDDGRGE